MEYTHYFQTKDERSSSMQIGKDQGEYFQHKSHGNFIYDRFRFSRGRGGGHNFRHQNDNRAVRGKGNNSFQVRSKNQNWRREGIESRGKGGARGRGKRRAGKRGTTGGERGAGRGKTGRQRGGERRREIGQSAGRRGHMSRGNYRRPAGGSSSEEDYSAYCEYCNLDFKTTQEYHVHTQGMLHTQRVLEGKMSVREKPQPNHESNVKSRTGRSGSVEKSGPEVRSESTEQCRPIITIELTEKPESALEPIVIDESDSDEDTDTTYCMYCNMDLKTAQAYYIHTRGMLHTQKVSEDKKIYATQAEQEATGYPQGKDNAEDVRKVSEPKEQKPMKIPVKERDYTPNDVVREQISVPYHCKLCDVLCTGPITYKMHLDGSKHKMNVALAEKGDMLKGIPGGIEESQPTTFSDYAKDCDDIPLIGLQYVTEFHTEDEQMTQFVCNMCECWCDGETIIPHLTGLKHRQKYFEEEHPHIYNHITSFNLKKSKADLNETVTLFAKDVEEKEGRKEVKIRHYVAVEDKNVFSEESSKKELTGKHKAFEVKMTKQERTDTTGEIRRFVKPYRGKFHGTGAKRLWHEGLVRDMGSGGSTGFQDKFRDSSDLRSKDWQYKRQRTSPHLSYSHYDDKYREMEPAVIGQEMARHQDLTPGRKNFTSASFDGRPSMEALEHRHHNMHQSSKASERHQWEIEESHMQTRLKNYPVGFNSSTKQYQNHLQSRLQQPPSLVHQHQWGIVSPSLEHQGTADDVYSTTHKGIMNMSGKGVKKNSSHVPNPTKLKQHTNIDPTCIRPFIRPATSASQGIYQEMNRQVWSHQLQRPSSTVLKPPFIPNNQQENSSLRASAQGKSPRFSQRPQPSEQALKDLRKRAEAILNKCLSSAQVFTMSVPVRFWQDPFNR